MKIKKHLIQVINSYKKGERIVKDDFYIKTNIESQKEIVKRPRRDVIINYFLSLTPSNNYLEIGVRDPKKNFNKIICKNKYSVDPGVEFAENPVDFKVTSDEFFKSLDEGRLSIPKTIKFDVVFIDGLHIAEQVEKDILNSLKYITEEGFLVLHDCNPPTEFHQRDSYDFLLSPAGPFWNGTTWKAFYKFRHRKDLFSICFDTDWGVGIISKKKYKNFNNIKGGISNSYFDFNVFNSNRKEMLNLRDFNSWVKK